MPIEAVVADASVLLSAVIGKAAQKVFSEHNLMVHASEFNANEVREYLPVMADKYALPMSLVDLRWRLLPLIIHRSSEYAWHYRKALADLKGRDPEDAHAPALARELGRPLWSNDRHLTKLGIPCYTTAKLLKVLERRQA